MELLAHKANISFFFQERFLVVEESSVGIKSLNASVLAFIFGVGCLGGLYCTTSKQWIPPFMEQEECA